MTLAEVRYWREPLTAEERVAILRAALPGELWRIDPPILELVLALNRVPGLVTSGSCGGHPNPKSYQRPSGCWSVYMEFEHSEIGWRGLEFLTWFVYGSKHSFRGQLEFGGNAFAPWEEEPGARLWFTLESTYGRADKLAELLDRLREKHLVEEAA